MTRAAAAAVALVVASLALAFWLIWLGTSELETADKRDGVTISCGRISDGPSSGGVVGCDDVRRVRFLEVVLVAVPTALVFRVTHRAVRRARGRTQDGN